MPTIGTDTFLLTDYGKPFSVKGFGNKMREWCDAAGVPPITDVNGKSKNVAIARSAQIVPTRLAETGCNVFQIAAISGHKDLPEVQLYVEPTTGKSGGDAMATLVDAKAETPFV